MTYHILLTTLAFISVISISASVYGSTLREKRLKHKIRILESEIEKLNRTESTYIFQAFPNPNDEYRY